MSGAGLLSLLGLIAVTAGGGWFDHRRYATWLTPFVVLAAPFTTVAILAYLLAPLWGFVALDERVLQFWLAALFVFWLLGFALLWPFHHDLRRRVVLQGAVQQEDAAYWLVIILAWLAIAVMLAGFQLALTNAGGWQKMASTEFRSIFGRGLFGHANVAGLLLLIYLIGCPRLRQPVTLVTLAAIIVMALLYGVKSWVILPVLAGIYYRISSGRLRVTLRLLLMVALLGFLLFFAVYLVRFTADGTRSIFDPLTYADLLRHFAAYLFAGVLGFSEFLRQGREQIVLADSRAIFAPFANIYRFLLQPGAPMVTIINPNYLVISPQYQKLSNVPTLVGTLWLYWGASGMLLYIGGLSLVAHFSFLAAHWLRNCWLLVLWSFFAALLSASWFEMYFWHLTSIEIPVLAVAMIAATALASKIAPGRRQGIAA